MKEKIINLPLTKKDAMGLHAGDVVLINGMLVTGRDKAHKFLFYRGHQRRIFLLISAERFFIIAGL